MREHMIIEDEGLKLPDDWLVIIKKNGWVFINRGGNTIGVKTETGLILVNVDKGEVSPDYLGGK